MKKIIIFCLIMFTILIFADTIDVKVYENNGQKYVKYDDYQFLYGRYQEKELQCKNLEKELEILKKNINSTNIKIIFPKLKIIIDNEKRCFIKSEKEPIIVEIEGVTKYILNEYNIQVDVDYTLIKENIEKKKVWSFGVIGNIDTKYDFNNLNYKFVNFNIGVKFDFGDYITTYITYFTSFSINTPVEQGVSIGVYGNFDIFTKWE